MLHIVLILFQVHMTMDEAIQECTHVVPAGLYLAVVLLGIHSIIDIVLILQQERQVWHGFV